LVLYTHGFVGGKVVIRFGGIVGVVNAQAAVDGEWTLCRYYIDQLQTEWDQIKPDSAHRLDTIIQVDQVLAQLHALALDQDQVGIIQATTQLTQAFSHLFSS